MGRIARFFSRVSRRSRGQGLRAPDGVLASAACAAALTPALRREEGVPRAIRPAIYKDNTMTASEHTPIIATLVAEQDRLAFLPTLFGRLMMHVESGIYDWMRQLCPDYDGGYWEFVALSNGGGYLRSAGGPWVLEVSGNGFRGTLSGDAAGMVVTLFALSHLSFRFPESDLGANYHRVLEFAKQHPEAGKILAAID